MDNLKKEALADPNLSNTRWIVRRSENPHPMSVIGIVIISLLVICYLYKRFLKPSASGVWVDSNLQKHVINHNVYKDIIKVDYIHYGIIKGNLIVLYKNNIMTMGIWIGNEIEWTDGNKWNCICGY